MSTETEAEVEIDQITLDWKDGRWVAHGYTGDLTNAQWVAFTSGRIYIYLD